MHGKTGAEVKAEPSFPVRLTPPTSNEEPEPVVVVVVVVVAVVVVGVIGDFVARHLKYVSLAFWRSQIQDRIEFLEQK